MTEGSRGGFDLPLMPEFRKAGRDEFRCSYAGWGLRSDDTRQYGEVSHGLGRASRPGCYPKSKALALFAEEGGESLGLESGVVLCRAVTRPLRPEPAARRCLGKRHNGLEAEVARASYHIRFSAATLFTSSRWRPSVRLDCFMPLMGAATRRGPGARQCKANSGPKPGQHEQLCTHHEKLAAGLHWRGIVFNHRHVQDGVY